MKLKIIAFLTSFAICGILTTLLLPLLKRSRAKQEILHYVKEHSAKNGTPTMGGVAFLLTIALCSALFFGSIGKLALFSVTVALAYGLVGFLDDFIKVRFRRNLGLKAYQKIAAQLAIALLVAFFAYRNEYVNAEIWLPFSVRTVSVGKWMIPFVIFIFLACTNGVNLTDGIDGLATGVTICYLGLFFVYVLLRMRYYEDCGCVDLAREYDGILLLISVSVAALVAFRLFNCYPAKIFMGDTGSLALGGLVAGISVFTKFSLLIPLVGIMYVVSCGSVILQVLYYKRTKKRVFLMAPFHHHLQEKGYSEPRIVAIYCTVTLIAGSIVLFFLCG